jgi:hypothetical protein
MWDLVVVVVVRGYVRNKEKIEGCTWKKLLFSHPVVRMDGWRRRDEMD